MREERETEEKLVRVKAMEEEIGREGKVEARKTTNRKGKRPRKWESEYWRMHGREIEDRNKGKGIGR